MNEGLTEEDLLWHNQNVPNVGLEDFKKILDTIQDDKGENKEKQKQQDKGKKIPVKKYSRNGRGRLYESVIIGQVSKFIYLDEDKRPQFIDDIPRVNDTLIPGDTIDTQNPIPIIFESKEELEECLKMASKESLDSLFSKVESINKKYVDVEDHYHVLVAANIIWTWLQDKFGYTHYIIIVGDNGSGKNSQLLVFKYLGYRVFYIVSASAPNYYTKMGNVEEGQITIAEDEAEDIALDREKRNVYKNGYSSGGSVPKVELEGGRKSEDWLTYCQKWAAMEELPERNMKGIADRSFILKFVVGNPQYNIKDVIKSAGDPKFKPLYEELTKTRKILFCWRLLHHDDPILDVDLNVKNRSGELTKPLIRLFQDSPIALKKILNSLTTFIIERNEIKNNSFESKLYDVIDKLRQERKERFVSGMETDEDNGLKEYEIAFTNPSLLEKSIEVMDCEETERPNVYWSRDLGRLVSQSKITSICKSKFKAKSISKKIGNKTFRCLEFQRRYLDKIQSNYNMPEKIEIVKEDTETKEVTLVTGITLPSNIQHQIEGLTRAQSNLIYEKNILNHINNCENLNSRGDNNVAK
jgi:hypothetical protein